MLGRFLLSRSFKELDNILGQILSTCKQKTKTILNNNIYSNYFPTYKVLYTNFLFQKAHLRTSLYIKRKYEEGENITTSILQIRII